MTFPSVKKLLANNGVPLAQQVAEYRLKKSGIKITSDLLKFPRIKKKDRFSLSLVKRLAGC